MKSLRLVIFILIAAASTALILLVKYRGQTVPSPTITNRPSQTQPTGDAVTTESVATGLSVPWAMAFASDGRLFFTERTGRVRVVVDGQLKSEPVITLNVAATGEAGLMGLALDPDFSRNHYIYIYYTYRNNAGSLRNRLARLTETNNTAASETVLLDNVPGSGNHDGGRIKFGPDGKLYVTAGDSEIPSSAQNLASLAGKILRLNTDGSRPDDNPIAGSLIYSYGHRNPQGIAWQPGTNQLYSTEHGPSGLQSGNDEVNKITPGGNYGWPQVRGIANNAAYTNPVSESGTKDTWAPAGMAFYTGNKLGEQWTNALVFTGLRGQGLWRMKLDSNGAVTKTDIFFKGELGRLRDVVMGPDGFLYIATSNRDGRGTPKAGDDQILRIKAKQ